MYLFIWILLWNQFSQSTKKYIINKKINKNLISFTHSIVCCLLAYNNNNDNNAVTNNDTITNNYMYLYYFSTSYFIWDTLYILYNKEWSNSLYVYHHLVCIYALNELVNNNNCSLINEVFLVGEISNFFNFIVYHTIKIKVKTYVINSLKLIQLLWFSFFRLIWLTNIIYNNFLIVENREFVYIVLTIHLLSIVWIYKQFISVKKCLMY